MIKKHFKIEQTPNLTFLARDLSEATGSNSKTHANELYFEKTSAILMFGDNFQSRFESNLEGKAFFSNRKLFQSEFENDVQKDLQT